MARERDFIIGVPNVSTRTFVDLGAGYGRVLRDLVTAGRNVVAIEINPDMFEELRRRAQGFDNVSAIEGDILNLPALLKGQEVQNPVFLILQNTLGTIEGDYQELLKVVVEESRKRNGELVLGILRQPALGDWGLEFYASLQDMIGEIDMEKTDAEAGILISKTGYVSKWWTDEDIEGLKKLGRVEGYLVDPDFCVLRLSFNRA